VFKKLKSSRFLLSGKFILEEGSFQHSLSYISAELNDAGQYICLVMGKDSKQNLSQLANQTAYIQVISPNDPSPLISSSSATTTASFPVSSLTIVLSVLGSVVLLLLLVLAALLLKPAGQINLIKDKQKNEFMNKKIEKDATNTDLGEISDVHDKLIHDIDEAHEQRKDPSVSWVWSGTTCQNTRGVDSQTHNSLARGRGNTFIEFV